MMNSDIKEWAAEDRRCEDMVGEKRLRGKVRDF